MASVFFVLKCRVLNLVFLFVIAVEVGGFSGSLVLSFRVSCARVSLRVQVMMGPMCEVGVVLWVFEAPCLNLVCNFHRGTGLRVLLWTGVCMYGFEGCVEFLQGEWFL